MNIYSTLLLCFLTPTFSPFPESDSASGSEIGSGVVGSGSRTASEESEEGSESEEEEEKDKKMMTAKKELKKPVQESERWPRSVDMILFCETYFDSLTSCSSGICPVHFDDDDDDCSNGILLNSAFPFQRAEQWRRRREEAREEEE